MNMEAAFVHLAVCDILSQAQSGYMNSVGGSVELNFLQAITTDLDSECRQRCKDKDSMSSLNSCINSCYQDPAVGVVPKMLARLQSYLPTSPALNACSAGSTPVINQTSPGTLPVSTSGIGGGP